MNTFIPAPKMWSTLMISKHLTIMGIRGVPARHGGFETFAEHLCHYLVARGWSVTIYCQEDGIGSIYRTEWEGARRIHIPVKTTGPLSTIIFDFKSITHSLSHNGVFLTLGYNTAVFNLLYRLKGKCNIINMDGIEWSRLKWGIAAKSWLWLNERFGCWFGNHLVADHPVIEDHLSTRISRKKITMIPYGAREIREANERVLSEYDIEKGGYGILIARPEPENSVLEIITAFSVRQRDAKLVVLGDYNPESNDYHRAVKAVASSEVIFLGGVYDSERVAALRFFARFYVHGHQVGGTNPSLVEALGAGNAVLAHDNVFNRWVAKDAAIYFSDIASAETAIDRLLLNNALIDTLQTQSKIIFDSNFQWNDILSQYESLLKKWLPQ